MMLSLAGVFLLVTLGLMVFVLRASRRSGTLSCPTCGAEARFHEPYWMCDGCERLVGVSIQGTNFVSR
jgi:hypothetical protein